VAEVEFPAVTSAQAFKTRGSVAAGDIRKALCAHFAVSAARAIFFAACLALPVMPGFEKSCDASVVLRHALHLRCKCRRSITEHRHARKGHQDMGKYHSRVEIPSHHGEIEGSPILLRSLEGLEVVEASVDVIVVGLHLCEPFIGSLSAGEWAMASSL